MLKFLRRSLQAKLILTILLVILIPAGIITTFNVLRTRENLTEVIRLNQEQLVQAKVVDIEKQLAAPVNDIISIGQSLEVRLFVEDVATSQEINLQPVQNSLANFLNRFGEAYNSICLIDGFGFEVACVDYINEEAVLRDESLLQDRFDTDYFVSAIAQTGHLPGRQTPVSISPLQLNDAPDPEAVIYYSTLLQTNTGVIGGVIAIEASMEPIFQTISANVDGQDAYLVDEAGVYWMHPDPQALHNPETSLFDARPNDAQLIVAEPLGIVFGTVDRPDNLMTFARVRPEGRALRWHVIYEQPISSVLGDVNQTSFAILGIMFVSILAASALAIFVTRSIVAPLSQLAAATNRFVETPNKPVELDINNQDEIGDLARSFDLMTHQIRDFINTLEEKVQERTAELVTARDEAERANDAKSAFLASTSHELRTPLNAILNFSGFIAREKWGPVTHEQKDALTTISKNGRYLLNLINDLLDMSKIASGSLEIYKGDVQLNDEIDEVIKIAEGLLENDQVRFITEVDPDLPPLFGDGVRIRQIMINLVSNAIKFTDAGEIRLVATHDDEHFQLRVEDTGPGIKLDEHDAVFAAFRQTESGILKGKGTGLGMPISKSLAEAHNGKLWFDSTPGQGTTFYLELPLNTVSEVTSQVNLVREH